MFEELRKQLRKNQDTDHKIDSGLAKVDAVLKDIHRVMLNVEDMNYKADLKCVLDEIKLIMGVLE